jgi:hypothetical protein
LVDSAKSRDFSVEPVSLRRSAISIFSAPNLSSVVKEPASFQPSFSVAVYHIQLDFGGEVVAEGGRGLGRSNEQEGSECVPEHIGIFSKM